MKEVLEFLGMFVDDLAPLGAMASAAMILSYLTLAV